MVYPAKGTFDQISTAFGNDSACWAHRAQRWHPVVRLAVDLGALILVTFVFCVVDSCVFIYRTLLSLAEARPVVTGSWPKSPTKFEVTRW